MMKICCLIGGWLHSLLLRVILLTNQSHYEPGFLLMKYELLLAVYVYTVPIV